MGQIVFWLSPQRNLVSLIGIQIILSLKQSYTLQSNKKILAQADCRPNRHVKEMSHYTTVLQRHQQNSTSSPLKKSDNCTSQKSSRFPIVNTLQRQSLSWLGKKLTIKKLKTTVNVSRYTNTTTGQPHNRVS